MEILTIFLRKCQNHHPVTTPSPSLPPLGLALIVLLENSKTIATNYLTKEIRQSIVIVVVCDRIVQSQKFRSCQSWGSNHGLCDHTKSVPAMFTVLYFSFTHSNLMILYFLKEKGICYLQEVIESKYPEAAHLVPHAQYNIGRAYYEGFGVRQSDAEAERYFLLAAQDGSPKGSVKAQTVLAMFYARPQEGTFDLSKVIVFVGC